MMFGLAFFTIVSEETMRPSKDHAIRFGLLRATGMAPWTIFSPAKTHSEVIIAAVAAHPKKAAAYAKKYEIPIVH